MSTFEHWWDAGFTEVIPIIPPGARIAEKSGVNPSQAGKIPGEYFIEHQTWTGMHSWTTRVFDRSHARKWDRWPNANKGLKTGKYVAVDLDCNNPVVAEVRKAAGAELGRTIVRGRENSDRQLMLYRLKDGEVHKGRVAFIDPKDPETEHAVEFLGVGGQCVVEGQHPRGGSYYWIGGQDPITVGQAGIPEITLEMWEKFIQTTAALVEMMGYTIISKSLLAGGGNRYGIPHDAHLADDQDELKRALTFFPNDENGQQDHGSCVRIIAAFKAGMGGDGEDEAQDWYLRYAGNNDAGFDVIWKSITDSTVGADWLYANAREHGYGGVDLPALPEPEVVDGVRGEDLSKPKWLRDMNDEWFFAPEGGKGAMWRREVDRATGNEEYKPYSPATFGMIYENKHQAGAADDDAVVWRKQPRRREFLKGVVFEPGATEIEEGYFNFWRGWGVEAKEGDCSLFKQHMLEVLCSGSQECYDYLWGWLAHMIQRPTMRGHPAVVLFSEENRTGKGVWARYIRRMVGRHGMMISNAQHLVGRFNGHLRDTTFLECEEAIFAKNHEHADALKSLIADDVIPIENKFFPTVNAPNRLHVVMLSNHRDVVPADMGERERYFVLEVSACQQGNGLYFEALCEQMDGDGTAALLWDLQHADLTHFDIRSIPQTEALGEQKLLNMTDDQMWWRQCLLTGNIHSEFTGETGNIWETGAIDIPTSTLQLAYENGRPNQRKDAKPDVVLGMMLQRFLAGTDFCRHRSTKGSRPWCYFIPKLSECRGAFDRISGTKTDWEGDSK